MTNQIKEMYQGNPNRDGMLASRKMTTMKNETKQAHSPLYIQSTASLTAFIGGDWYAITPSAMSGCKYQITILRNYGVSDPAFGGSLKQCLARIAEMKAKQALAKAM